MTTTENPPLDEAKHATEKVKNAAGEAQATGRRAIDNPVAVVFVRLGYAIKGALYIAIGLLAAGIASGHGSQAADQRGALLTLDRVPLGRLLLSIIAIGLFAYALWNLADAALDVDRKGNEVKAILERVGYTAIGFSYAGIGLAAIQLALGSGSGGASSDAKAQDWTARLLALPFGVPLVVLAGLISLGLAAYQLYRAATERFDRQLVLDAFREDMRRVVSLAGRLGYGALGVIFGLVGLFLIVAALHHNAGDAKGLGGALQVVAAQADGSLLLGLIALGLIGYGAFALVEARYRRIA